MKKNKNVEEINLEEHLCKNLFLRKEENGENSSNSKMYNREVNEFREKIEKEKK